MFKRIMAMVVAVIVLLTGVLSVLGWVTITRRETAHHVESLREEAREIAYLASQYTSLNYLLSGENAALRLLKWKAAEVYEEYGAYIVVVDRSGRVMDNMKVTYAENPDFAQSLNSRDIYEALYRIVGGEEIEWQRQVDGMMYVALGVPFVQNGSVLGAVFIQTPAQRIEADTGSLLAAVIALAFGVSLLAGGVLFGLLKRELKPLTKLTASARAMAEGDFSVRSSEKNHGCREIAELTASFNTMADKVARQEASRREFVANVSHELRSPITAIGGYVEGMRDGTIPAEEHAHYLTIVGEETGRLSRLIGELLNLSRLEKENVKVESNTFDVCELLSRVLMHRTGDLEKKEMEVQCDFAPDPCYVEADESRIEQVAVNLLDNAIKFTPTGGEIALKVRVEGGKCIVTVQDNGTGILPEDRPHVFERFYTADKAHTSGKGTGLGLSICQRIMEMHGECIRLLDTDKGAAFEFTLKKAERDGSAPRNTEEMLAK